MNEMNENVHPDSPGRSVQEVLSSMLPACLFARSLFLLLACSFVRSVGRRIRDEQPQEYITCLGLRRCGAWIEYVWMDECNASEREFEGF